MNLDFREGMGKRELEENPGRMDFRVAEDLTVIQVDPEIPEEM